MAPTMKTTPTNKLRPSVAVYTKQCTQIIYSSTRLLGLAQITGHLISSSTTEFVTPFFNPLSDQITSQVERYRIPSGKILHNKYNIVINAIKLLYSTEVRFKA